MGSVTKRIRRNILENETGRRCHGGSGYTTGKYNGRGNNPLFKSKNRIKPISLLDGLRKKLTHKKVINKEKGEN